MITVIDTETDRLEGEEGAARIVELAAVALDPVSGEISSKRSWLFAPGPGGVTPRASAIHHLTDATLAGRPAFDGDAWQAALGGAEYAAAHNVAFDRPIIERSIPPREGYAPPVWLCTLKLARVAWPEAPAHSNQTLRYWLGCDGLVPPDLYPHRAGYDALVTAWILVRLLAHFGGDLERMALISSEPSLLPRMGFGEHRGKPWSEVPKDYLRWILRKDFDADVRHTARHWLER